MNPHLPKLALAALFFVLPFSASASTPTMCTMQYQPVCGAKQVQCIKAPCYPVYHTYGNSCTMNAEGGTYLHEGECNASESGPVKSTEPYVPPANCIAWYDGCNSCSRSPDGQSMCTMRACMDEPKPGYCKEYKKPGVLTPAPVLSSSTSQTLGEGTSTPASTTPTIEIDAKKVGFFERMWQRMMVWFSGLSFMKN